MSDSEFKPGEVKAILQVAAIREARSARERYDATGVLQSLDDAPHLNVAWLAARCAVRYASELVDSVEKLPKRFNWLGIQYHLIFPAEGLVQIADPTNQENLCAGFEGWVDPMKVKPKTTA